MNVAGEDPRIRRPVVASGAKVARSGRDCELEGVVIPIGRTRGGHIESTLARPLIVAEREVVAELVPLDRGRENPPLGLANKMVSDTHDVNRMRDGKVEATDSESEHQP
jgi:hypothetical protein